MPAGLLGEAEALAEPPHPLEEAEAPAEPPHPLPGRLGERVRRRRGGFLLIFYFTLLLYLGVIRAPQPPLVPAADPSKDTLSSLETDMADGMVEVGSECFLLREL